MKALPITWTVSSLHTVCDIVRGITFPASAKQFEKDELNICCLRTSNIQREIRWEDVYFIPRQYVKQDAQFVQIGDILMSMANSYELVGKVAVARMLPYETAFGAFLSAIRPRDVIFGQYLFHFLRSDATQHEIRVGSSQTTNIANISVRTLSTVKIPLPSLNEQKRIADKLDSILARVDACRERLDRIPAILKRFRQAVLAAATSGKLTEEWRNETGNDNPWRTVRLAEIAHIQGGVTKDSKKQSLNDEEVPYLRVANVQRGYLDLGDMKIIRIPTTKLNTLLLEPGDILFNEGGDIDKLGRGWIWEGQIERCSFQNHVFRARLYDKKNQPKYISWWGNYRGLNYFLRSGKQTTNLASINKSMLSELPINLPSSEEQTEIVRRVEELFAYADRIEARYHAARARVDKLTPAILAKAFRGELVPQNPDDEPASVLLDRIQASRAKIEATLKPKRSRNKAISATDRN
ncbi:MAG: restriction endonuclease subunit S [Nitrosomonas sp.]|nr:restriction endonuclease subunit S [Nitrosomonas sp.]